jgi:hypothetical protein
LGRALRETQQIEFGNARVGHQGLVTRAEAVFTAEIIRKMFDKLLDAYSRCATAAWQAGARK